MQLQRQGMRIQAGGSLCCANHGLSLVITAHGPAGARTLLFDGGPVDYAVERNGVRLGIDFGAIEAVMLSHGHWDHAGGMPARARHDRAGQWRPRRCRCILHPGMFRPRGQRQSDGGVLPMDPIPPPDALGRLRRRADRHRRAATCLDGPFYISGEIPRLTAYETGVASQVLPPDRRRGLAAGPAADGRALPRGACPRQGPCGVQRLLARRHRQRAAPCPRLLPRREVARGDGRLAPGGADRGGHSGDGARPAAASIST